jgi:hypothetical protein
LQDELGKAISRVLVAADSSSDEALGYIVGWLIAGELQVNNSCVSTHVVIRIIE